MISHSIDIKALTYSFGLNLHYHQRSII